MRILAAFLLLIASPIAAGAAYAAPADQIVSEGQETAIAAFDAAIEAAKNEMMANPNRAQQASDRALIAAESMAPSTDRQVARATALWLKAGSLIGLNQLDEAGKHAADALAIVEKARPNTKLHGDLLRSRGAAKALSGHVQEALSDYLRAHDIFRDLGETRSQAIALQDIGQTYWEAGDYERTLRYYAQSNEIYNDDPGFSLSNHNNLGETYRMLERYGEAEAEYQNAFASAQEIGSPLLQTRILSNLALVQIEGGKLAEARRTASRALRLAQNGEAADWRNFVYGVMARIAFERGDLNGSARYLDQTFAGSDLDKTDLVYRDFHELAATVFDRIGQPQRALAHLKAFQRLDSEARDLTASASSQLMAARFDFANQTLRISQLKQGQLERDIQIERQRTQFRTTAFIGFAIASTIVLILILIAFFSIRRSRNEVRATNTQLRVVNTRLEDALKAKTDFLAMTSHEIRTPLNGILGMTQVLLANRKMEPNTKEQIRVIHGSGETMKALVDDLLDVAKMENGEISVQISSISLRPILEDAGRMWRSRAQAKDIDLHVELDSLPTTLQSDGNRIRQIVFNLVSNAVKFTRQGSITLRAHVRPDDGQIAIEVSDTGCGISLDQQSKVFEAFHQIDSGTTRAFSGTGLGLSICQNLALALGGTMELDSEPGKGSTFRLLLPLTVSDTGSSVEHAKPATLAAARIVLLEANPMKQAILAGVIEPHVKSIHTAADDAECRLLMDTADIDHVVMDAASAAGADDPVETLRELINSANALSIGTTVLLAPGVELPLETVSRMDTSQLLLKPLTGEQLIANLQALFDADDHPDACEATETSTMPSAA